MFPNPQISFQRGNPASSYQVEKRLFRYLRLDISRENHFCKADYILYME